MEDARVPFSLLLVPSVYLFADKQHFLLVFTLADEVEPCLQLFAM